ncbi:MAG: hypothetical protein ABH800_01940 [Candidatus Nealsonbacteria bacterium]
MAIEVKKQDKEPTQLLVRRFARKVKQSGVLKQVRKNRFRQRKKSHQAKKKSALRREELRKEYRKLRKMGKLGR